MLYSYVLTVPANTAEESPATQDMKLTTGVIRRVEVQFPIGTRATVHVKIYRGGFQVWPTNPDGNICADGQSVAWEDEYEVTTEPTLFRAEGWSTADTYDYDIDVRINMLRGEGWVWLMKVFRSLEKFLRLARIGV